MVFKSLFGINEPEPNNKESKLMVGKIYHLGKGWGFISSPDLEYQRIFFHWTGLLINTLNFKDLKKGMNVEFEKKIMPDQKIRAIKIKVLTEKTDASNLETPID